MTETAPSGRLQAIDLLKGFPVTIVGDGRAAGMAGAILGALGAEVTSGAPGWREVGIRNLDGEATVICDVIRDGVDDEYMAAVAARPAGTWVTISAFGLDGPLGRRPGSDLLCGAGGGLLGAVTDDSGSAYPMPGLQVLGAAGQAAALAALHGLSLVRGGKGPVHLDVSGQESALFCSVQQETAHVLYECGGLAGASRYSAPSGYFPCEDGEILITVIDDHQMVRMADVVGRPDWPELYPRNTDRGAHAEEINEVVEAWTRPRSKFECESILQDAGVPSAAVRTVAEAGSNVQYRDREFALPNEDGRLAFGSLPALVQPVATVDGGGRGTREPARTMETLRVAEITNVLAGPLAGSVLGSMGATVFRVEEEERLDVYRRNGPFEFGRRDQERAAYFLFANYSKRSICRRVNAEPDFPSMVVSWADMLLENLGPRRLEHLGLGPSTTMVSMSGFGRTGRCAHYKAYAPNVHAFAGLAGTTRELAHPEATIRTSFADYTTALWAATLATAWWLGGSDPLLFDLSMSEVIATKLDGLPSDPAEASTVGADVLVDTPGMVIRCADGSVAVAMGAASDAEVLAAAGLDESKVAVTHSPVLASADASATDATTTGVHTSLEHAGFGSYPVLGPAGVLADAHLAARGFLVPMAHPGGPMKIFALPWKIAGTDRVGPEGWYRRSPMLGEDDDWIDEQMQDALSR